MFTAKKNMRAREVQSTHDALLQALASQDTWFDGGMESIDKRRSDLQRAANLVRRAGESGENISHEALFLAREARKLEAMESRIITETTFPSVERPKVAQEEDLCVAGRKFISMHLDSFLADNIRESDPEEIAERAENYAEIGTIQLPSVEAEKTVDAFVCAVLRKVSSRKGEPEVREVSANVESLPDDILFL